MRLHCATSALIAAVYASLVPAMTQQRSMLQGQRTRETSTLCGRISQYEKQMRSKFRTIEDSFAAKLEKSAPVSMSYTRWIRKLTRFAWARPARRHAAQPREEAHQGEMCYVEALCSRRYEQTS